MEVFELTGQELMDKLNWKKGKAYDWIRLGKFKTVQTPEGKKALLTLEEIEKYKTKDDSKKVQIENENVQKSVQESSKISDNQLILKLIEDIKNLSFSAGQTKLLEDSENRTKDKYYELKSQFDILQESYKLLETEISELKKENQQLKEQLEKKSSFFGIKFGK